MTRRALLAALGLFLAPMLLIVPAGTAAAEATRTVSAAELDALRADTAGRPLLLVYWASWCGPCRRFKEKLADIRREVPESRLAMLGVSLDSDAGQLEAFLREHPLPFPTVRADDSLRAAQHIPVPTTVLYRADGGEEKRLIGDVRAQRLRHYVNRVVNLNGGPVAG